jgi:hypothetical protein
MSIAWIFPGLGASHDRMGPWLSSVHRAGALQTIHSWEVR